MTKAQFTPGPWEWQEIAPDDPDWGACEIVAPPDADNPDGQYVCTHVFGTANAHLIAASPDLLGALKAIVEFSDDESLVPVDEEFRLKLENLERARAAIAKAEATLEQET